MMLPLMAVSGLSYGRARSEICMNETHALPENCLGIRSRDDLIETPLAGAEEGVN